MYAVKVSLPDRAATRGAAAALAMDCWERPGMTLGRLASDVTDETSPLWNDFIQLHYTTAYDELAWGLAFVEANYPDSVGPFTPAVPDAETTQRCEGILDSADRNMALAGELELMCQMYEGR